MGLFIIINLFVSVTEIAKWATPSRSRPQVTTDNGNRDGNSNWQAVFHHSLLSLSEWTHGYFLCTGIDWNRLSVQLSSNKWIESVPQQLWRHLPWTDYQTEVKVVHYCISINVMYETLSVKQLFMSVFLLSLYFVHGPYRRLLQTLAGGYWDMQRPLSYRVPFTCSTGS